MNVADVEALMEHGKYDEALKAIEDYPDPSPMEKMGLLSVKADIMVFSNKFQEGLEIIAEMETINQKAQDITMEIACAVIRSGALRRLGRLEDAIVALTQIWLEHEDKLVAENPASLSIKWIARYFHELANVNLARGNLADAELNYGRSIPMRQVLDDRKGLASVYNKIGMILKLQGEFKKSLEHLEKSLELDTELGNQQSLAITLGSMGLLYAGYNDKVKAQDYLQKSLDKLTELGNDYLIVLAAYNLYIQILNQDPQGAETQRQLIKNLSEKKVNKDNINMQVISSLVEAISLKYSNRGRDKYQAQDMLKEIADQGNIQYNFRIDAMLHLIELLLDEYYAYQVKEAMIEVIQNLKKIEKLADENKSHILLVESYLIESRLMFLTGDVEQCHEILKNALDYAQKYKINQMVSRVNKEKTEFEQILDNLTQMVEKAAPILESVHKERMDEYLHLAKNIVNSAQ